MKVETFHAKEVTLLNFPLLGIVSATALLTSPPLLKETVFLWNDLWSFFPKDDSKLILLNGRRLQLAIGFSAAPQGSVFSPALNSISAPCLMLVSPMMVFVSGIYFLSPNWVTAPSKQRRGVFLSPLWMVGTGRHQRPGALWHPWNILLGPAQCWEYSKHTLPQLTAWLTQPQEKENSRWLLPFQERKSHEGTSRGAQEHN